MEPALYLLYQTIRRSAPGAGSQRTSFSRMQSSHISELWVLRRRASSRPILQATYPHKWHLANMGAIIGRELQWTISRKA